MRREKMDVFDLVNWIEKNIEKKICISDIIKVSGYGHWYMQRKFKKITGFTIYDYLLKRRLIRAADELRSSCYSIKNISEKYAWCSQQNFTRSFKKHFGLSPARWRSAEDVCYVRFEPELKFRTPVQDKEH